MGLRCIAGFVTVLVALPASLAVACFANLNNLKTTVPWCLLFGMATAVGLTVWLSSNAQWHVLDKEINQEGGGQ